MKVEGEGTHEAIFAPPVPHWIMWGQPVNFYMSHDDISSDRVTSFRIINRLSRNIVSSADHQMALTRDEVAATGDSFYDPRLLAAPIQVNVHDRAITFSTIDNPEGHLAGFGSDEIEDISFDAAVNCARASANLLAISLSAATNIPCLFETVQVQSVDMRQQYTRVTLPYPTVVLTISSYKSLPAMEPFITLYAEGLRAQSPFYRFLCFFKIADKLLSTVLQQLRTIGNALSVPAPNFSGTVPSDPFDKIAPVYVGKKYTAVRDSLQERYRNVIAHLDLASPLRPFDVGSEADVGGASRVMAYIAHDLLYRTYEYIKALEAAGYDVASLSLS